MADDRVFDTYSLKLSERIFSGISAFCPIPVLRAEGSVFDKGSDGTKKRSRRAKDGVLGIRGGNKSFGLSKRIGITFPIHHGKFSRMFHDI